MQRQSICSATCCVGTPHNPEHPLQALTHTLCSPIAPRGHGGVWTADETLCEIGRLVVSWREQRAASGNYSIGQETGSWPIICVLVIHLRAARHKCVGLVRRCRTKLFGICHAKEDFANHVVDCELIKIAMIYGRVFSDRIHDVRPDDSKTPDLFAPSRKILILGTS